METNEIMTNEEVMETATEEIATATSKCGSKALLSFGLGTLAGVLLIKVVIPGGKKLIAKFGSKKTVDTECVEAPVEGVETEEVSDEKTE